MPDFSALASMVSDCFSAASSPSSQRGHLGSGPGRRGAGIVAAATDRLRPGEHGGRRMVDGVVGVADHAAAAAPGAEKTALCTLLSYSSSNRTWQVPQTADTDATCGGVAPWLPWQEAQLGAERSPRLASASQCTLGRYSANWLVGILYFAMCCASAWQWAQVSGRRSGWTGESGVLDRADVVHAVAIDAGGDGLVARGEALAVDAGLVLLELIDAFARVVAAHEVRIAVAAGAELRHVRRARACP